jgi:tellurite resistance protein TerC
MQTIASPLMWTAFGVLVVLALFADLVLMRHGGPHRVTFKEALGWSVGWVVVALAFGGWLWWYVAQTAGAAEGQRIGLEYLTGYLIEKSLAIDNIFVFLMLFSYFAVPEVQRQKVLVLGVLGAIALRAVMIFAGALLLAKFHWILYVFGAFLLLTGIKMMLAAGKAPDLEANPLLKWMRRHLSLTDGYRGDAFVVRENGLRRFTPLFVVMALIGITDVIFAVDSIPAIFAITTDPFVVLTSNVFAVLGLRAMFFLLAGMADRFHLLPYGLAAVLIFIGVKMLVVDVVTLPVPLSLGIVAAIIGATVVLSLLRPQRSTPVA